MPRVGSGRFPLTLMLALQQLRDIADQLLAQGDNSVEAHLADIRNFITESIGNLNALLAREPRPARKELLKHVSEKRIMLHASVRWQRTLYCEGRVEIAWESGRDGQMARRIGVADMGRRKPAMSRCIRSHCTRPF
uniref:Uncharacterized protein n=1 Tax=Paracidobacterium acidisoli TaxID=2303751 RepID=A0A372IJM1_9BACT